MNISENQSKKNYNKLFVVLNSLSFTIAQNQLSPNTF